MQSMSLNTFEVNGEVRCCAFYRGVPVCRDFPVSERSRVVECAERAIAEHVRFTGAKVQRLVWDGRTGAGPVEVDSF